jgi:hypothetical protein
VCWVLLLLCDGGTVGLLFQGCSTLEEKGVDHVGVGSRSIVIKDNNFPIVSLIVKSKLMINA